MNDPYFSTDLCVERLFATYLKHRNLLIAIDFDDSIFDFHKKGYQFPKVIEIIKECNALNFHVIIFTASQKERHEFIAKYCEQIGIKINCINRNSIQSPFGNDGKIFYNIFLCDRAGLFQAYTILRKTLDRIYRDIENKKDGIELEEIAGESQKNN